VPIRKNQVILEAISTFKNFYLKIKKVHNYRYNHAEQYYDMRPVFCIRYLRNNVGVSRIVNGVRKKAPYGQDIQKREIRLRMSKRIFEQIQTAE